MTGWRASPWAPWTGLFAGAAAWAVQHQVGADANAWDCRSAGAGLVIGLGIACALATAAGGWISWRAGEPDEADLAQNRRFARAVGVLAAGVFLLAILLQSLAGVLVPACHR